MVYSLYRSDLYVLAIPFWALTEPIFFLPLESLSDLHGFSMRDSQILGTGTWTHFRPQAPHYHFGAPGNKLALHLWTTVLWGPKL